MKTLITCATMIAMTTMTYAGDNCRKQQVVCSGTVIHVGPAQRLVAHTPVAAPAAAATDTKDIVDTAVSAKKFSTLVAAVKAAGLVETLKGDGPFTVFAPNDEAFAKLPQGTIADLLKPENKAKLTAILTYHVVPGKVMAADVVGVKSAKTVNGKEVSVTVEGNTVMIDQSKVVATDIAANNGVIHVIDSVLLP